MRIWFIKKKEKELPKIYKYEVIFTLKDEKTVFNTLVMLSYDDIEKASEQFTDLYMLSQNCWLGLKTIDDNRYFKVYVADILYYELKRVKE